MTPESIRSLIERTDSAIQCRRGTVPLLSDCKIALEELARERDECIKDKYAIANASLERLSEVERERDEARDALRRLESAQLDSPNSRPKELDAFEARGYERINRHASPAEPLIEDHAFVHSVSAMHILCVYERKDGTYCDQPKARHAR